MKTKEKRRRSGKTFQSSAEEGFGKIIFFHLGSDSQGNSLSLTCLATTILFFNIFFRAIPLLKLQTKGLKIFYTFLP